MSASLPTGIVTFLFTDIEGSTQLWEREPERMQAALAVHDRLLRQAIEGHGGQVLLLGVTAALLEGGLPAGVSLRPLGEHRLRDLSQPERVFQVVALESLHEAPSLVAASNLNELQPTVLTTLAEMALAAGRADGAATLGGLLANHPLTWNETRPRVAAVVGQARAALGDEAAGAAEARGRSLDATALIARLAALPPDLAAWLDLIEELGK